MKVFIILDEANRLGAGTLVEKVFADKEKAIDYYCEGLLKHPYYRNRGVTLQELKNEINEDSFLHEAEVE